MRKNITILFFATMLIQCATTGPVRFPVSGPMLVDQEDFRPSAAKPEEYLASTIWDGVDEILLRPVPELFTFRGEKRATNVNALDEVPDSSWFTNRPALTPEAAARGACDKPIDPKGPFEILSGKPDGWNPGFLIKAPDGRKYFFKFDQHDLQPERMSMAEVVGSLIYHSVGFTVPCYEILYFDRSSLVLTPKSSLKDKSGKKIPMTDAYINEAFKMAKFREDGKVRAVSSLLLEGPPLGPWTYTGTADDDPNDVVPHEDRREVRAGYVLASWLSHFDTRDQNTLRTWMEKDGKGYVRHNILDFGDSLGNLSDLDAISRRLGYAHYLDFSYFAGDLLTFGLIERPWDKVQYGPAGPVLGYYDIENFDPENWRPGYPNPGFLRMTEADAAWMARKISDFRDEHLKAIVERAQLQNPLVKTQLVQILSGRRDKLLKRWFRDLSPLTDARVTTKPDEMQVCFRDLAVHAGLVKGERRYQTSPGATTVEIDGEKVCVSIHDHDSLRKDYLELEVGALNAKERPLVAHLARVGSEWKLVGLLRE